jgi:hypothetical protein
VISSPTPQADHATPATPAADSATPRRIPKARGPISTVPSYSVYMANLLDVTPELLGNVIDGILGPNLIVDVRLATDRKTGINSPT